MYSSAIHFSSLYQKASHELGFLGHDRSDWVNWRARLLPRIHQILGLDIIANSLPGYIPTAAQVDSEDTGDFIRQRWVLWVEPHVPLPFILLLPKTDKTELPLVITPHGHSRNTEMYAGIVHNEEERLFMLEGERDIAVQAVMNGYIAIAPTTRGFGITRTAKDIEEEKPNSCHNLLKQDLLVGRTPIGDRVWDVSRLIDWALNTLPVNPRRIAVTGNSGGGTTTLFSAACDERIAVAVPASYFCTFEGSIGSISHCDCNYLPGILQAAEMADVAGLIAPRPFCAINGRYDTIFPLEHVQTAYRQLQKIYAAAQTSPDFCELFVGEGGHRYYKQGAWAFIARHFARL